MDNVILIPVPIEEFKSTIAEIIDDALKKLKSENLSEVSDEGYLTRTETAKLLRVSLPTLKEYTKTGIITGYRIKNSRRVLYKKWELEGMLQEITSNKYKRKDLA